MRLNRRFFDQNATVIVVSSPTVEDKVCKDVPFHDRLKSSLKNGHVIENLKNIPIRNNQNDGQVLHYLSRARLNLIGFNEGKVRRKEEVNERMNALRSRTLEELESNNDESRYDTFDLASISRDETLLDIVFREENTEDAVLHSRRAFENHYDGLQDSIRYHGLNPSDYPVAVICVCSASEPEPQNQLELMLRETMQNAPCFVKQRADVDIVRHFVVLQDVKEGGAEGNKSKMESIDDNEVEIFRARNETHERALMDVKRKFSEQKVSALTINFSDSEFEKMILNAFIRRLTERVIAPHMERLLYGLNAMIFNTRKGFKNQFKSFWGRNVVGTSSGSGMTTVPIPPLASGSPTHSRENSESNISNAGASTASYTVSKQDVYSSQESQIRKAADLSLFLGDIDNAIASYKLVGSDYKAEKNWKSCALAYEATGIALTIKADDIRKSSSSNSETLTSPMKSSSSGNNLGSGGNDEAMRKEADAAFEYAISCYAKVKKQRDEYLATVGGTPTSLDVDAFNYIDEMMVLCSIRRAVSLVASGKFRDAATTFAKEAANFGGIDDLQSALLLERASRNFLETDASRTLTRKVPKSLPWLRKHAFHAALAGHGYARVNARRAASRCYALSLVSLGHENTWHKCREHCLFSLARLAAHDGNNADAVRYFQRLLGISDNGKSNFGNNDRIHASRTETTQRTYLREYLHVVSRYENEVKSFPSSNVVSSPLPEVDVSTVFVSFVNDEEHSVGDIDKTRTMPTTDQNALLSSPGLERQMSNGASPGFVKHAARSKIAFGDVSWKSIEEKSGLVPNLQDGANNGSSNWLDGGSSTNKSSKEQRSVTAKDEVISITAKLSNPLRIPITMHNVSLEWEFTDQSDVKDVTNNAVACETISQLEMQPNEKSEITLRAMPKNPGVLRVIGIKWRLENTAVGKATFDIKAPLSRRDTAREKATKVRKIWVRDIPEESRLVFDIVDTVPRLEASFESSDGSFADASSAVVLDGSISKVNVAIRNVSDATARHVRIRLPSNAFTPCESEVHRIESNNQYGNVFAVRDSIQPKEQVCISCWFHPARLSPKDFEALDSAMLSSDGTNDPYFDDDDDDDDESNARMMNSSNATTQESRGMLCYQPEPPAPKLLRYRMAKLSKRYVTKRSIMLSMKVVPSPSSVDESICTLKAINCSSTQTFELTSIFAARRNPNPPREEEAVEFLKTTKLFSSACFEGDGKLLKPGKTIDVTFKLSRDVDTSGDVTNDAVLTLDGKEDKSEEYRRMSRMLCAPTSRKMCVSLQWKNIVTGVGDKALRGSSRCFANDIWFQGSFALKEVDADEDSDARIAAAAAATTTPTPTTTSASATGIEYSQTRVLVAAKISDAKTFPNGVVSLSSESGVVVPVKITCFNGSRERVDVTFDATDMNKDEEHMSESMMGKEWTTSTTDITSSLTQLDINKEGDGSNTSQQSKNAILLDSSKHSLSPYAWIRDTRQTIRRVPPGTSVVFDASLLVFKPGAYHVDNFKVYFTPSSLKEGDEGCSIEDKTVKTRRLAPRAGFSVFVA